MMLQKAASNAYSWWWASHIRTKQSKWLEQNVQDMEEKVAYTLKIIDSDGDTFAQRAEMYYRKRPEIVGFVEEAFRSYRALAERFDHLSRELQSANRTIAAVCPEHVQFPLDEDDEENPDRQPKHLQFVPKGAHIPEVPEIPKKDFRSQSTLFSRKGKNNLRRTSGSATKREVASSGLTKAEALEEIDKLQKGILAMQTEKEFARSSYENAYEKCWDIEKEITEMQKRVSSLQDEFGIGAVIKDSEARTLMASTALNSCRETVAKLEEKHKEAAQEAEIEKERIVSAKKKFEALRNKFDKRDADENQSEEFEETDINQESDLESLGEISKAEMTDDHQSKEFEESNVNQESDLESLKEGMTVDSYDVLTVIQLVEKIDVLVERVVSLETAAASQTVLVKTLRTETDELQKHVHGLEADNAALVSGSEDMEKRIRLLEEELSKVKSLYQRFEDQNNKLQTHLTGANCRINDLSGKLHSVKMDEDVESSGIFQEVRAVSGDAKDENAHETVMQIKEEEEKKDERLLVLDVVSEKQELVQEEKPDKKDSAVSETASTVFDSEAEDMRTDDEEETPNWRQLFSNGLDDRENILLEEYASVLRNYREVKRKLRDVDEKNRNGFSALALEIRERKNGVADRDIEIQTLRKKLDSHAKNPSSQTEGNQLDNEGPRESMSQLSISPVSNFLSSTSSHLQGEDSRKTITKTRVNEIRARFAEPENNSPRCNNNITTVEERVRADIDELLEQNLEFWLRFSTLVHQIQKFQTSVQDLKSELSKLNIEKKKQQDCANQRRLASEARPIYRHLRGVRTELQLWLENNAVLKDEQQGRHSSLCNIMDEISRVTSHAGPAISEYQAAKFHGEVLNMEQENARVSNELEAGLDRVRALKIEAERVLKKTEDDFGISNAQNAKSQSSGRPRIPLRSFLFGVKLKKHKQQRLSSFFSCVGPSLQKQYSFTCNPPDKLPE